MQPHLPALHASSKAFLKGRQLLLLRLHRAFHAATALSCHRVGSLQTLSSNGHSAGSPGQQGIAGGLLGSCMGLQLPLLGLQAASQYSKGLCCCCCCSLCGLHGRGNVECC